jgi:hypothetical protein
VHDDSVSADYLAAVKYLGCFDGPVVLRLDRRTGPEGSAYITKGDSLNAGESGAMAGPSGRRNN